MNLIARALPGTLEDPRYPDSDGRPMGDTQHHNRALAWLWEALEDHFADQDVFVASNLVFYYEEGVPASRKDPDVLVARGVGKHLRRSYRLWEEGVLPCVLFEVASRKTWRVDVGEKRGLYARLGVKEYFVFDPEGRYLRPALQGFRTSRGKSVPLKPAADGSLASKELGLRLVPEGGMLRLIDLRTGQPVPTRSERAEQEKLRAEQERQRADALRDEVERLRALLEKQKRRR